MLFDLIRAWAADKQLRTNDGDYRESNTTTETTRPTDARATIVAQSNNLKREIIVTIKCET